MTTRVIEVDPSRFDRWMAGFAERHGPYDAAEETTPGGVVVSARAADGSAVVATPFAFDPLGVILVRRGGYAVGLARAGVFTESKVGTRHVQSRTAAPGVTPILDGRIAASVPALHDEFVAYRRERNARGGWD